MPSKNPAIISKHNKAYYDAHKEAIARRGHVLLEGRSSIEIIIQIAFFLRDSRRWVSTEELMERFNIGHKQVAKYIRKVEQALPLIVEKDSPVRPGARGHMNYYKVVR